LLLNELTLTASLEALLFAAPDPLTSNQLASILDASVVEVELGLLALEQKYLEQSGNSGIRLQKYQGRYQLTTAPEAAGLIEKLLGMESSSKLSRPAVETLAIIAYQQPITRPHIDAIRGVNSDSVVRSLLNKGLISEVGRSEAVGRPILYSTSLDFLHYFGLNSISDLPPLNQGEISTEKIQTDERTNTN
jgi:segregation and condensation protein B